jgi:hypothetical protein
MLMHEHCSAGKIKNMKLASPAMCLRRPGYLAELAWKQLEKGNVPSAADFGAQIPSHEDPMIHESNEKRQFQIRQDARKISLKYFGLMLNCCIVLAHKAPIISKPKETMASRCWVAVNENGSILLIFDFMLIVDEIHVANFAVHPEYQIRD